MSALKRVSPAPAGMIPNYGYSRDTHDGEPRTRGDDPIRIDYTDIGNL